MTFLPFIIRPILAILTRTFFQPDEYFQSLEPAHHIVFGYGHLTWEWLSNPPIRSIAYPALFVPPYWLLKLAGLENTQLLILAPRLLAGLLAAFTDLYTVRLATSLFGKQHGKVTLLVSLASFFHSLSLTRTLSNSLETSLTIMALYYWPLPHNSSKASLHSALTLAALSCIFRPTAAVMWVFLWLELALRTISTKGFRSIWSVIIAPLIIGTISVAFIFALDSLYYGTPTFTPLNFLKVNSSAVSLFYGSNPFHYYITQAIPILCTSSLPFVVHGILLSLSTPDHAKSSCNVLLGMVAWTIGIYSLAGHKEWRFIHPLLPILHIFAARSLAHCYTTRQKAQDTSGKSPDSTRLPILPQHLYILLATIPASIYVLFFHSSGQISLVQHLRSSQDLKSVGFLMPCHSTPWQAYVHRPDVEMWALGCEPPLRGQDHATYYDQTRVFYEAPLTYLKSRFPSSVDPSFPRSPYPFSIPGVESQTHEWNHTWPSHIAMFGSLLEGNKDGADIKQLLLDQGYREIWSVTNGFEEDSNRRGGVHLWSWKPSFSGIKFNQ